MDKKELGTLIRQKRKEKNMTQEALAEKLYVSTNAVSKWEAGKNAVSKQYLETISEILDIPLSLLQDNQEAEPQMDAEPPPETAGSPSLELETDSEFSEEEGTSLDDLRENDLQEKQQDKGKRKFLFLGVGILVLAVVVAVIFMWQGNQNSYTICEEYLDSFNEQNACYLIVEYRGKLTIESINEYNDSIRENYNDYFEQVDVIVVLFCQDYNKDQILSLDTADVVMILEPDPYEHYYLNQ